MQNIISYKDYSRSVVSFFNFLKMSKDQNDLMLKSIKIRNNKNLILIPISNLHLKDIETIQNLCNWRNNNSRYFIQGNKTNIKKTKNWMKKNLLNVKDKILFLFQ